MIILLRYLVNSKKRFIRSKVRMFQPEELSKVHVVWRLFETKPSAIVQVHGELGWESLGKNVDWR